MRRVLVPPARAADAVRILGGETMGTRWSVRLVAPPGSDLGPVEAAILAALDRVDRQMSTWRADSDLSRFNRAPAGTRHVLPAELCTVLDRALAIAADSGGAYDPTIGALVDLWGFGPAPRRIAPPAESEIATAQARTGWRRIAFERADRQAAQPGEVSLDLSAIAKGHAVDLVSGALDRAGLTSHLVDVGGELRGRGTKPDGGPWWVAIERPGDGATETVVALHGLSVATSGDYRKYFETAGRRYAHTIDPRTGRPVAHALASATVIHPSCMEADALATALTVLGPVDGLAFARDRDIAALFLTRRDGALDEAMTPAFAAMAD